MHIEFDEEDVFHLAERENLLTLFSMQGTTQPGTVKKNREGQKKKNSLS